VIRQPLDLALCLLTCFSIACADSDAKALSHAQIADRDRPGTVLIETIWTVEAQVGKQGIDVAALVAYVRNQVNHGLVSANSNAEVRAIFDELLKHPTNYLKPAGPPISLKLQTAATGSGFIVTPDGYLVTNAHVVYADNDELKETIIRYWQYNDLNKLFNEDFANFKAAFDKSSAVDAQSIEDKKVDFVKAEMQYYSRYLNVLDAQTQIFAEMGVAIPGLHVLASKTPCDLRKRGEPTPGKDVAVLKIEQKDLPTVPLGDDSLLRVGDTILVIGYPGAADLSFTNSKVESTLTQGELSARKEMPGGWSALQTSAEINHGNSGGPAFNERGEAIGLATFTPAEEGVRGINFLVPIGVAKEFLDELGVKPHQSRLSELYSAALDNMDRGEFRAALDKFKEVSDLSPGFPFIQDKIAECRNSIDQGLDPGVLGKRNYLVGGVALVLILLTLVWFFLRRSPARTRPVPVLSSPPPPMQPRREPVSVLTASSAAPLPVLRDLVQSFGSVQSSTGQRYEVTTQGLLVGRDPTHCQIVLNDDSVSKEHAWIVPVDEGTVVIDRGSANGTFLNSADSPKISKVRLRHGDRIFIAKSSAVLTYFSS
jgi:S1-C subfamily serine protease